MADQTKIEWTDATWNPITGCSVVSPGCTNCYAMKLAGTRLKDHPSRAGLTVETKAGRDHASGVPLKGGAKHVWNGKVRFNREWLDQPLRWKKPRMIFVCAHGDLFHESVPDEWIDQVFAVMALSPQHTFLVLTKRPERMRGYLSDFRVIRRIYELACDKVIEEQLPVVLLAPDIEDPDLAPRFPRIRLGTWPLPNVWLGVSVEDQRRAEERIPILLDTPAAVRWISAEPLLGPIDVLPYLFIYTAADEAKLACSSCDETLSFNDPLITDPADIVTPRLDWVVAGGESGQDARPMHPDWARSLRDQCADADVPFLFKQWGQWLDADQFLSRIEEGPSEIVKDGKPWRPARPLNFTDAAQLAEICGHPFEHRSDGSTSFRLDKARAGRTLDGVIHDAFPQAIRIDR